MKIAVCSDEAYPVHRVVRRELEIKGHECVPFGAFEDGEDEPWALVAERAAVAVASGQCAQGVFFCWSGTGIAMAANKINGIRAALCFDAATVRAAREWNDANVLCLSNRALSDDVARELLFAWFEGQALSEAAEGLVQMRQLDDRHRKAR